MSLIFFLFSSIPNNERACCVFVTIVMVLSVFAFSGECYVCGEQIQSLSSNTLKVICTPELVTILTFTMPHFPEESGYRIEYGS